MKIIIRRRNKRVVMEIPDILLDVQPEPVRYTLAQLYAPITDLLSATKVSTEEPTKGVKK